MLLVVSEVISPEVGAEPAVVVTPLAVLAVIQGGDNQFFVVLGVDPIRHHQRISQAPVSTGPDHPVL